MSWAPDLLGAHRTPAIHNPGRPRRRARGSRRSRAGCPCRSPVEVLAEVAMRLVAIPLGAQ
eukprot:10259034-Heterocapsa_arctica.AAC.1